MTASMVVRSWRDEEFLESLTEVVRRLVPLNPAGSLTVVTTLPDVEAGTLINNTCSTIANGCCSTLIGTCSIFVDEYEIN